MTRTKALYLKFKAIHEELTVNECQIVLQTFSNTEQTLYELVESLNNENLLIKLKLEKYVINPLLVNQMYANQPEYLQENTEHLGYGIVKPIQKRHEIVQLVIFYYLIKN